MPDIVALGEAMVELFADEPLDRATQFHRSYGGDTLNVVVAASRLGSTVGYISRVGKDPFGSYLKAAWAQEGLDVTHVTEGDEPTGLYFIALGPRGERSFIYYRKGSAAAALQPEAVPADYISSAKFF